MPTRKKKNLILISLDSVRADVGYSGQFAAIEKLRREGVTFLNTISSSPLTPVSHATVLTGLQPYHHGIRHLFREQLNTKASTLAQILKKEGYKTGAIVSCPGMNHWYGFSKGFDHYDDEIPRLADGSDPLQTVDVKKRGTALKRAPVVIERGINWLEKNKKKPFFLFLHFFDAHWPYEAPEKFGGKNAYEEEVAYACHYLENFFDYLKAEKLFDQATIACFSDHGEDLAGWYRNDKAGKKLGHPEEEGHGCLLYDQTQKTILVIKDSELAKNKKTKQQVRLVDILPTMLDSLKIKKEMEFDGVSLLPAVKGADMALVGYSETFYPDEQKGNARGVKLKSLRIDGRYKIIWEIDGDKSEIYDLKKDPEEKRNLFSR